MTILSTLLLNYEHVEKVKITVSLCKLHTQSIYSFLTIIEYKSLSRFDYSSSLDTTYFCPIMDPIVPAIPPVIPAFHDEEIPSDSPKVPKSIPVTTAVTAVAVIPTFILYFMNVYLSSMICNDVHINTSTVIQIMMNDFAIQS